MIIDLFSKFGVNKKVSEFVGNAEDSVKEIWDSIYKTREYNQFKVIQAMQHCGVSESHLRGTTGYGYDDRGRDVLDKVYAEVFNCESALVRHQIVSGTQALAICFYGNLRPGDELISITGNPYDTLEEVIGIRGEGKGSLRDFGITYKQVDLKQDGKIDVNEVVRAINPKTKMVFIQRSSGYSTRSALLIEEIRDIIAIIKSIRKDLLVLIDNCYGEFVQQLEPTDVGADLVAGSLIKNPGGGLAPTGGYIAGKEIYVQNAAYRLTSPGLGKKVGCSQENNRLLYQGLFLSPHVVAESLKGAVLCARVMENLKFDVFPSSNSKRGDIIQAIRFGDANGVISFCQGVQASSAVDSFVKPEPWDMPGYNAPVIMAAGTFIQGASIEFSADAPIKPPYIAYMQGGMVYEQVKLGVLLTVQDLVDKKLINI
jgi:cystathionine beta-lyase family protein involved in aluminum resistance